MGFSTSIVKSESEGKLVFDIGKPSVSEFEYVTVSGMKEVLQLNVINTLDYDIDYQELYIPPPSKIGDWVCLMYKYGSGIMKLSLGCTRPLKLVPHNKNYIMGMKEPLNCDIDFITLKLTYINHSDGWVIV